MDSGSFDAGLLNLANWTGNVIMPTVAVLIFVLAIYRYSHGQSPERYVTAGMAALCVSALVRLAEAMVATNPGPDQYYYAILNLVNWVGNVIMPVYAGFCVCRAVVAVRVGNLTGTVRGDTWMRHVITAAACLSISAIMRLAEYLISQAKGVGS